MLCLRLDGEVTTSYFIILIPVWVFLVYISIFLVISGLASTNQRVNKCERITLSILVPIGFILSLILGLVLLDDHATFPVYAVFIPLLASIIFSYLYVRCLIKPGDLIKVKPEASSGNVNTSQNNNMVGMQESSSRGFGGPLGSN